MQFVASAAEIASHLSAQQREHFVELVSGLHARIDCDFDVRGDRASFLEEAERKAGANAKSVLAVNAALGKGQLYFLARRALTRNVGKINGAGEHLGCAFFCLAYDQQRKRWPGLFLVAQLEFGKHRLLGENVLGHVELQVDASENDARQYTGNQNAGERAGENHEEKVVAGVYRREHEDEDSAEINDSFAREP